MLWIVKRTSAPLGRQSVSGSRATIRVEVRAVPAWIRSVPQLPDPDIDVPPPAGVGAPGGSLEGGFSLSGFGALCVWVPTVSAERISELGPVRKQIVRRPHLRIVRGVLRSPPISLIPSSASTYLAQLQHCC